MLQLRWTLPPMTEVWHNRKPDTMFKAFSEHVSKVVERALTRITIRHCSGTGVMLLHSWDRPNRACHSSALYASTRWILRGSHILPTLSDSLSTENVSSNSGALDTSMESSTKASFSTSKPLMDFLGRALAALPMGLSGKVQGAKSRS